VPDFASAIGREVVDDELDVMPAAESRPIQAERIRPVAGSSPAASATPAYLPRQQPPSVCNPKGVPGRRVKAIRLPSGDQVGLASKSTPGAAYRTSLAAMS
jgi:hypothetical protein